MKNHSLLGSWPFTLYSLVDWLRIVIVLGYRAEDKRGVARFVKLRQIS